MVKPLTHVHWLSFVALLGCSEAPADPVGAAGASASAAAGAPTAGRSSAGGAPNGGAGSAGAPGGGAPGGGGSGGLASGGFTAAGGPGVGGRSASGGQSGSGGAAAGMSGGSGVAGVGGATGGTAGAPAGGGGGTAGGAPGAAGGPSLPPTTDYSADGPFETTIDRNTGPNSAFTVFRPATLGENGFLHAPIIFGPGIGQAVTVHTTMLTKFASHGFVVVGTPVLSGGPGDAGNRMSMLDGLEWILAQNAVAGMYQGKLYADHAIAMGFSVGGTSAVEVGSHESVATVVSIHGHRATSALHGTMLQTTGTEDNVGMPLQQQTYDTSEVPTFLATLTGAPHGYIESNGGGEQRPAIVAWMRYWIYGDTGATAYFFGDDCTLCDAPWENPQRKNWP